LSPLDDRTNREFVRTRRFAYLFLVVAPLIYLVVPVVHEPESPIAGEDDLMFYILLIVAIMQPLVIPLIERMQIAAFRKQTEKRMLPAQLYTSIAFIRFAVIESIYIFGLVVYLVSSDLPRMGWFYFVGIIWTFVHWPRMVAFQRFMERMELQ
jgi:hypothetical protein